MENPRAYLIAYTPQHDDPVCCYSTTDYGEVYRFKKLCIERGIEFSIRFKKVDNPFRDLSYIYNRKTKLPWIERLRRFINQ